MRKPRVPAALDRITDVVLAYRPKPKTNAGSALPDALCDALRDESERGARPARPAEPRDTEPRDVGAALENAGRDGWLGWPPGPDDAEGWRRYIAAAIRSLKEDRQR